MYLSRARDLSLAFWINHHLYRFGCLDESDRVESDTSEATKQLSEIEDSGDALEERQTMIVKHFDVENGVGESKCDDSEIDHPYTGDRLIVNTERQVELLQASLSCSKISDF